MGFTHYTQNAILNELTGKTNTLNFNDVYLGLCTSVSMDGTYTELAGNGYSRVLLGNYSIAQLQYFGTPTNGSISNTKEIQFPMATGNWSTVGYGVMFNAATGGSALAFGTISGSLTVSMNEIGRIGPGAFNIYFSNI